MKRLFLSPVLFAVLPPLGDLPYSEKNVLDTLRARFQEAAVSSADQEANLRGVRENWVCSQYFLFKEAFFEVPNQPIQAFYGTLFTSRDQSRLRETEDGDLIGEWTVAEARIFPQLLREVRRYASNQHGIQLSDAPELAGVPAIADHAKTVLFYVYCPKPGETTPPVPRQGRR